MSALTPATAILTVVLMLFACVVGNVTGYNLGVGMSMQLGPKEACEQIRFKIIECEARNERR